MGVCVGVCTWVWVLEEAKVSNLLELESQDVCVCAGNQMYVPFLCLLMSGPSPHPLSDCFVNRWTWFVLKLTGLSLDCFHTDLIMSTSWAPNCCSELGNSFQMVCEHFGFCCCCLPQLEWGLQMWLCVEHILVLPGLSSSLFLPVPSCSTFWSYWHSLELAF